MASARARRSVAVTVAAAISLSSIAHAQPAGATPGQPSTPAPSSGFFSSSKDRRDFAFYLGLFSGGFLVIGTGCAVSSADYARRAEVLCSGRACTRAGEKARSESQGFAIGSATTFAVSGISAVGVGLVLSID